MNHKTPDLLASYFTLAGDIYPFGPTEISPIPFRERVDAAASAGWKGIGLIHADVKETAAKIGYGEMRRIVEGSGLKYLEIEFLSGWYLDGEERSKSDQMRSDIFSMAEQLGIDNIKIAPGLGADLSHPTAREMTPDLPRMAEEFAKIGLEAAGHGARISLEIMPFSNIRSIKDAVEVVRLADQPGCGILLDIWHLARGGIAYDEVARLPSKYISAIELNDAKTEITGELWQDTIYRRLLPGDGDLNPPKFIKAVEESGYTGYWGVEILSEKLRKLPVRNMAMKAFDATILQFKQST